MIHHNDDWRMFANCATTDPDLFFPNKGDSAQPAKRICAACDVREMCEAYATETSQQYGIWAGMSPKSRHGDVAA